jgi:hypothetical protein
MRMAIGIIILGLTEFIVNLERLLITWTSHTLF